MGRKKLDIVFIKSKAKRLTTYRKRRSGLFKKAREISKLSGAKVLLAVQLPEDDDNVVHCMSSLDNNQNLHPLLLNLGFHGNLQLESIDTGNLHKAFSDVQEKYVMPKVSIGTHTSSTGMEDQFQSQHFTTEQGECEDLSDVVRSWPRKCNEDLDVCIGMSLDSIQSKSTIISSSSTMYDESKCFSNLGCAHQDGGMDVSYHEGGSQPSCFGISMF